MFLNKRVVVVMPAYNAAKTLKQTYNEIPFDIVDDVILVNDYSKDDTVSVATSLGIRYIISHEKNKGYGGNQKTCYIKALEIGADIIIMLHPDYQYTPKLIGAMVSLIATDLYPVVFASRILGNGALKGGMPLYKYIANRCLTLFQNLFMNHKLSEYHTGYRAYNASVLRKLNFKDNSDDFIFDNQIIAQLFNAHIPIGEISCPTKYFDEASSINFYRSVQYGMGIILVTFLYCLHKLHIYHSNMFKIIE